MFRAGGTHGRANELFDALKAEVINIINLFRLKKNVVFAFFVFFFFLIKNHSTRKNKNWKFRTLYINFIKINRLIK
jgi:hypothetical protein